MQHRNAFTMVELLIVLAIIALLTGGAWWAYTGQVGYARIHQTTGTIETIADLLKQREDAFATRKPSARRGTHYREQFLPVVQAELSRQSDRNRLKAIDIAVGKAEFRDAFPQTWAECPEYARPAVITPSTESAEVLYWFLAVGEAGGLPPDTTSDKFTNVADTDANGKPEILDGWGRPIRFYRWPTRVLRPAGGAIDATFAEALGITGTGVELGQDPDDMHNLWGSLSIASSYHDPLTWHAPLVVSAGGDSLFGLDVGTAEPGNVEDMRDNYSSWQR